MAGREVRTRGQRVLTQAEVEDEIMRLSDAAEDQLNDLANRAQASAEAEHAYKVKFAKERLRARAAPGSGPGGRTTGDEADDVALSKCDAEYLQRLITEAHYETAKQRCRTTQTQLDALRTIAANIRSQT